jgi:copper/silver-translocating P-type ATPase
MGCQTVYQILETRQELQQGVAHPLFEQALRSGIISNPALVDQLQRLKHDSELEWTRWTCEVEGLWCPACAEVISLLLLQEKGVRKCVVDYATDVAVIEFAPIHVSKEKIQSSLKKLGYELREFEDSTERKVSKSLLFRLGISAFCAMNIMMFTYPVYISHYVADLEGYSMMLAWIACITSLPVVTYCFWPIFQRFFSSMRIGYLGMEALVTIGVLSAFFLSLYELFRGSTHVYFDSMAMIVVLVLTGKMVETKAKASAKNTLMRLSQSLPRRCRKKTSTGEQFVKIGEMQKDDLFVVVAGEKIPLDGIIISGECTIDESIMTGESLPCSKQRDCQILSGTLLVQGHIIGKVTRTSQQTALSRIVEMVSYDLDRKKEETPLVDRIVRLFVPFVVLIAVFAALMNGFMASIAVLLIACPCAIGIASPLAEARTVNHMASLGVIVRNRRVLQWLGREQHYFFDKTGTITKGELKLVDGLGKLTFEERSILKSLVVRSTHPLCKSLTAEIKEEAIVCERIEEVIGKGMRGFYRGREYRFGSSQFSGIDIDGTIFVKDGELIASLHFEDELKPEMVDYPLDVPATILSGDRKNIVEKIARQCGFEWIGELSPLQKKERIDEHIHAGRIVGMVGDGINDAPALTAAQVSISVLTASDISIQVSDLLFTTDNMLVLPKIRSLAQQGRRIAKQNLFWAFIYNVIGVGLAAAGMLTPIYATAAMVLSSLFVVGNVRARD